MNAVAVQIGVQASLDTVHDAGSRETSEDSLEVECALKDHAEHMSQIRDIDSQNDQGYQYVGNTHDRDQHLGDLDQALRAAQDDRAEEDRQDDADDSRRRAIMIEAVDLESRLQIVGCQHVVSDHIGADDQDREDDTQPSLSQRVSHVERRAALRCAIVVFSLIDLRQSRLDERGCSAEERCDPHPEDRTGASADDSCRDSDDVSGAYTGCCGYHQRAER